MTREERPEAAKLGWKLQRSDTRFENKVLRLREDQLEVPKKGQTAFAYAVKGAAVIIVPVTADGQMVLLRQFRYPVDEWCLEVPAGTTRDTGDTPLEEVAAKELKEEIGATFERLEKVGSFFSNSSLSDEECHVFLALGTTLSEKPKPEPMESIEILLTPLAEAVAMVRQGRMKTGPSALAVLLSDEKLRAHGII